MLFLIIWLPILTALALMASPIRSARMARDAGMACMALTLGAALYVFFHASAMNAEYTFESRAPWIPSLGISYHIGVDHLSAMLILLTSLVGTAAVGVTPLPKENAKYHYALGLIMVGGMAGAFASLDLFFLYIFHEFALIPTFVLIGIWGAERRRAAAMKITLYLGLGSLILLLGLLGLVWAVGGRTFDLLEIKRMLALVPLATTTQVKLFGILFLGFGILISGFPFHTWAPAGYGEAPPLASMLHAGVIKKFGFYGLMVVAAPLLPDGFEMWKPWVIGMAFVNLLYCGYVAMQQSDLRYMLAYASVSHMGYAFLAFAANTHLALQGLALFLFAHGLSAATGFGIAGFCREKTGTSNISEMGGLARKMPFAAAVFTMVAFAGCGMPGFANFPAELMIFMGSFQRCPWVTVAAVWTAVISAVYMLRAARNAFLGPLPEKWISTGDVDPVRRAMFALLLAALLATGFWPRLVTDGGGAAATYLVQQK